MDAERERCVKSTNKHTCCTNCRVWRENLILHPASVSCMLAHAANFRLIAQCKPLNFFPGGPLGLGLKQNSICINFPSLYYYYMLNSNDWLGNISLVICTGSSCSSNQIKSLTLSNLCLIQVWILSHSHRCEGSNWYNTPTPLPSHHHSLLNV